MLQGPHGRGGMRATSLHAVLSVFDSPGGMFRRQAASTCGPARFARILACLLYAAIFCWSDLAYAFSPSTECPPTQTMTVASGGSATVDLSGCSIFGLDGMPVVPSHGTVPNVDPAVGNGDSLVTYHNNSDGALS